MDTIRGTATIQYESEEDVLAALLLLSTTALFGDRLHLSNMKDDSISDIFKRYLELARKIGISPDMFNCCNSLSESDIRKFEEVSKNHKLQRNYRPEENLTKNYRDEYERYHLDTNKHVRHSQHYDNYRYQNKINNNNQLQYHQETYKSDDKYGGDTDKNIIKYPYYKHHPYQLEYQKRYKYNKVDQYRSYGDRDTNYGHSSQTTNYGRYKDQGTRRTSGNQYKFSSSSNYYNYTLRNYDYQNRYKYYKDKRHD